MSKRCFMLAWRPTTIFLFLLGSGLCFGQFSSPASPGGVNAALTKLFGRHTAFTAKVFVQVLDQTQRERIQTQMDFSARDGMLRVDIDMNRMKSGDLPAGALAALRRLGMDRVTSIIRPDKKESYLVYPHARSYVVEPMSKAEVAATSEHLKVEKTALGIEKVDGHPSVKNRVVLRNNKGKPILEATTWNATDLKNFPVQIATKEKGKTSILRFQDIQFTKPAAKKFEPPRGFTRYNSPEDLTMALSTKWSGQSRPAKP